MTDFADKVDWMKADSRGRVNLGTGYKDKKVKIAVIEVEDE